MNLKSLEKFLLEFGEKAGYGSNNEKATRKESDGSTTIFYKSGKWEVNDNFFGGEPYGGRTIVLYNRKPYWIMVYYGAVYSDWKDFESVYGFLKKALMEEPTGRYHFRGPKKFVEGKYEYLNGWQGDMEKYFGEEKIKFQRKDIYWAKYMGGLVDLRKE